jgi:Flp pilus assembly protein TadD
MKWFSVVAVLLMVLAGARAEGPEDRYVAIYNIIQEADSLNNGGQFGRALARYREAQTGLLQFQKGYPDWNANVVNFRLKYVAGAIDALAAKAPAPAEPAPSTSVPKQAGAPSPAAAAPGKPAPPPDWENQLNALGDQVRNLQEAKASLEAKLKEALAAQPGTLDPRQLAKADERIKALLKENDLLKVSLDQEKAKPVPAADPQALEQARQALVRASRDLAEQTSKANALEKEKNALQVKLNNLPPSSYNAGAIESSRKQLESANRKLAEQTKLASQLAQEKEDMLSRFKTMQADSEAASALRAENQILRKQVADLKAGSASTSAPATSTGDRGGQLARAQEQIAALEQAKELLRLEKEALENQLKRALAKAPATTTAPQPAKVEDAARVQKLEQERDALKQQLDASRQELTVARAAATTTAPPPAKPEDAARLKQMQQERDDLRKKLAAASKELNARKSKTTAARVLDMEKQMAAMRGRLDVLEASQVPFTAEEAALFRVPESRPVETASKSAAKASKELPPSSVALYAEAKRYYSAKQLDKAEDRYLQVLREDQNHVPTLVNLAAVELQLNHLPQAETNIMQALALAPDDPACLAILGNLRFRQMKYDVALDVLSRAAKADPRNAEVQNYLGLTLSAKGLRGPAETALRKAIQLEPNYGDAHNNLAVIYATQKPPLTELARWHYQRALDAGIKPNPDLEKLLEPKKPAEGAQ